MQANQTRYARFFSGLGGRVGSPYRSVVVNLETTSATRSNARLRVAPALESDRIAPRAPVVAGNVCGALRLGRRQVNNHK
mmetsp:Transcript_11352/g.48417  ORF Transcript_11352/g.48417 Transcript_11352/m.48417 type:complete len:80 (-) Transcript_11352:102-341(-)